MAALTALWPGVKRYPNVAIVDKAAAVGGAIIQLPLRVFLRILANELERGTSK